MCLANASMHIKHGLAHIFIYACIAHSDFQNIDERESGTLGCIRPAVLQQQHTELRKLQFSP